MTSMHPREASKDEQPIGMTSRAKLRTSLALFLASFAVRYAYARYGSWLSGDSRDYLKMARNIVFYHVFSLGDGIANLQPTAYRPPLYPFFVAVFWQAGGNLMNATLIAQVALGAMTVVLVYLIAIERFNPKAALIAAAGMTFAPMTIHYTAAIMTETLFTFLVVLGAFFWRRNKSVAAGFVFGLAALTRTTIVPFLVCLPLLTLLPAWRRQRRAYLLMLAAAVAVSSVWTIRNLIVFKQFILIQSGGHGASLLAGTVDSRIAGEDVWPKVIRELYSVNDADEAARERKLGEKAMERITNDPLQYLKTRSKQYIRLYMDSGDYLLGNRNVTFREALSEPRPLVIITKIVFMSGNMIVLCLSGLGLFLERKRLESLSHIVLFPAFLSIVHLPLWIENRYSLPAMPFVAMLAAVGLVGAGTILATVFANYTQTRSRRPGTAGGGP